MTQPGGRAQPADAGREGRAAGLATALPRVHEAGPAVLVVDLASLEVTYANDLARQLAPGLDLPVPVDAWSRRAGLERAAGTDLLDEPEQSVGVAELLRRVAHGEPVTAEAVTAMHPTTITTARETLWMLGLPLRQVPEPLSSLAILVFLPAGTAALVGGGGGRASMASLRDRAVLATRMSFTITDPRAPDAPLVWVNPAFTETTGYTFEESVGRNCRFLQGEHTDPASVEEIRRSLAAGRSLTITLLNYRKNGSSFWNELSISPVHDETGTITHFIGVQADVTARVEAQRARDDALAQVARAADRLALLADFTSRMAMSRHPGQIVDLLADALVPRVATWALVCITDETGRIARPHVLHERGTTDPTIADLMDSLQQAVPEQLQGTSPVLRVLNGDARHVLINDYDTEPPEVTGAARDDRTSILHRLDTRSVIVVPLLARSGILGAVALVGDRSREPFGGSELALAQDVAVRAGLMLENAQLYARERAAAATLQRSLLPRLPDLEDVTVAAQYVPATDEAAVGGDWYDVFAVKGGDTVAVVVGDVMGHDIDSAARMGKLSTIVRSYGWPGSDPRTVLAAVDDLLGGGRLDLLATCLYATLTRTAAGATLRYSSAGHPPALLREPDGTVRQLEGARGVMLGVSRLMPKGYERPPDDCLQLARGSTLICFTDGLTEAFAAEPDMDEGLAELARLTSQLPLDASPSTIIATLTGAAVRHNDDVAVVAICID
ncbi:MAG: SpoIIE family protein phosphatase [Jatrophihabitans sp.]